MSRRGRKAHTVADMRLMADFAAQFDKKRRDFKNVEEAAKALGVSRASLYNYWRKKDIPRLEVLQATHEKWGFVFQYGDIKMDADFFRKQHKREAGGPPASQYVLPFLEAVKEEDIKILRVRARKPSAVELVLNIKFAG